MIQSMTGYGKSTASLNQKTITVEIRSLNSKQADISLKMPYVYKSFEMAFRKKIATDLVRGKIEVYVNVENTAEKPPTKINQPLVKEYVALLKKIDEETQRSGKTFLEMKLGIRENSRLYLYGRHFEYVKTALRMPDVFEKKNEIDDIEETDLLKNTLQAAIDYLQAFRKQEGKSIESDFLSRIATLENLLDSIQKTAPKRTEHIKEKMENSFKELKVKADENRFEQELIFYMEKLDINEEISRLTNHLSYFKQTLANEHQAGKKLGFIAQEMGREINTIGSKANFAPLQKTVVLMKNELEKIKEQVLNTI